MKGWTGLKGVDDRRVREIGTKFYLIHGCQDEQLYAFRTEAELEQALNTLDYDDWCCVIAEDIEKAKERYEDAFLQWREWMDRGKMKVEISEEFLSLMMNNLCDGGYPDKCIPECEHRYECENLREKLSEYQR